MIKQTLVALKSLGGLKLLLLAVGVVVLAGSATWLYLSRTGNSPSPTSTPAPTSTPGSTPSSPSTPKQSETKPKPTPGSTPAPSTPAPTPTPSPSAPPPATPPNTPPVSPPSSSACTNYAWSSSANSGQWTTNGYNVKNNVWNAGEAGPQTIYACAWNNWYIISDQPGSGTDDSVKSYPSSQKLVDIPLSSMTTIPSSWSVATPGGGGTVAPSSKQWNVAYDVWLDDWDTEVMVWTNWTANWQYWYGVYNGVQVTIDGVGYHAYCRCTGTKGMWFVRDNVTNQGSIDLASILEWAVSQGWLQNTQEINAIEYGFEVMYTGEPTRFDLLNYSLTAN